MVIQNCLKNNSKDASCNIIDKLNLRFLNCVNLLIYSIVNPLLISVYQFDNITYKGVNWLNHDNVHVLPLSVSK